MAVNDGINAIYSWLYSGPVFGGSLNAFGSDIFISSDSNTNRDSFCNFGWTYEHPEYLKGTERAKSILAGSYKFQTLEIEVFAKIN